ncbi:MAG TPA: lysophospholipid acyltransferase family protein [Vicinamibacteria bacterium]|nr:lysophospholipid acyltransferase family protein [Vicinamibacteria bacterium]
MRVLAQARSLLGVFALVAWLVVGDLWERVVVWTAVKLRPQEREAWVSWFMKGMSRGFFRIVRLAGGRARRTGVIPTAQPCLVVMNHQSLLDVPTAVLMMQPFVSRFISRARYGRFVPAVSLCLRLLRAPLIEPQHRKEALRALRQAMRDQPHGILIFPEGHRTRDGEIQPFHTAGAEIMLRERRLPVYLVVTDGFWTCRRFVDFLFNIDRIDGRTEVLGPFAPPEDGDLASFLEGLRQAMVAKLGQMRGGAGVAA